MTKTCLEQCVTLLPQQTTLELRKDRTISIICVIKKSHLPWLQLAEVMEPYLYSDVSNISTIEQSEDRWAAEDWEMCGKNVKICNSF